MYTIKVSTYHSKFITLQTNRLLQNLRFMHSNLLVERTLTESISILKQIGIIKSNKVFGNRKVMMASSY